MVVTTQPVLTHEHAAIALERLLAAIRDGKDSTAGLRRFLKTWQRGGNLAELEIPTGLPASTSLWMLVLYTYVAGHPATVRPMAFGKHAEIARL